MILAWSHHITLEFVGKYKDLDQREKIEGVIVWVCPTLVLTYFRSSHCWRMFCVYVNMMPALAVSYHLLSFCKVRKTKGFICGGIVDDTCLDHTEKPPSRPQFM